MSLVDNNQAVKKTIDIHKGCGDKKDYRLVILDSDLEVLLISIPGILLYFRYLFLITKLLIINNEFLIIYNSQ